MEKEISTGIITYEQWHNKQAGSSKIRGKYLAKYWDEAELFKSGRKYDTVIYQKVYWIDHAKQFKGLKILDICDPDWLAHEPVAEMMQYVDAVTCPTENMANFMKQFGKPVRIIQDRHDLDEFKENKQARKDCKMALWFGYSHNFHTMKNVGCHLARLGLSLKIVSNSFIQYDEECKEKFIKYSDDPVKNNWEFLEADLAILPKSVRLQDRFKSNNRKTTCWLIGLPVAETLEELEKLMYYEYRKKEGIEKRIYARENYDVKLSVEEFKQFIKELNEGLL